MYANLFLICASLALVSCGFLDKQITFPQSNEQASMPDEHDVVAIPVEMEMILPPNYDNQALHIQYEQFLLYLSGEATISILPSQQALDEGAITKLIQFSTTNSHVKISLVIGEDCITVSKTYENPALIFVKDESTYATDDSPQAIKIAEEIFELAESMTFKGALSASIRSKQLREEQVTDIVRLMSLPLERFGFSDKPNYIAEVGADLTINVISD